jgi:DNA-binding transcriptional ArsR family regulator
LSVAAGWRGWRVQVGPPEALAISVAMFPQTSVIALLRQMASGPPDGGLGPAWPATTAAQVLRPASRFAALSFAARGGLFIPECVAPIRPLADVPVAEQASLLRDLDPGVLAGELDASERGYTFPHWWQPAARQPRRWLHSLADASLDAWAALAPRWKAAAPLLDREVQRVGTAVVRGGMPALLNTLHPKISYNDGMLAIELPHDRHVNLGQRRLALVPMIASRSEFAVSIEHPDVCHIGYPIGPPTPARQPAASSALALILGQPRAAALQALTRPLTVAEVAAAVQCAPTTVTYHLQQLAAAGLITRERHGTSIRASRTIRGDTVIDLLSD